MNDLERHIGVFSAQENDLVSDYWTRTKDPRELVIFDSLSDAFGYQNRQSNTQAALLQLALINETMKSVSPVQRSKRIQESLSTPQAVANFFLQMAADEGKNLTPLKLIKLVCIAYGWVLVTLEQRLFRERIEAWSFGPVVPSLYHEFKIYRKQPIDRFALDYDFDGNSTLPRVPAENSALHQVLTKVWDMYKHLTAAQLVSLTHEVGSPWSQATSVGDRYIDDLLIRDHYESLLEQLS
ncbi:MAG: SocA family protein [Candidatus Obscuribacter sp.]|nr:SocA family protein [Candidatus Obscuribacter sp.]MBK9279623.1 SocA family protein [Candidatus Obscuribacter sp.]